MMSAVDHNTHLRLLLAGCLDLWGVSGTVEAMGEEQAEIRTLDGTIHVRRIAGGWQVTAPAVAGEPPATWAHASVGPMLRSLRVLLAPDQPHARLIVARAPGAEA